MRKSIIKIALTCIALAAAATYGEEEDEFLRWLKSPETDIEHAGCTTNLLTLACTNYAQLEFSPARHHYAIIMDKPELQSVEVFEFGTTNVVTLYSHIGEHEELFRPIGLRWFPDADFLHVRYNHADLLVAHGFDYDIKTGKLIDSEQEEEFKQLEASSGKDRPGDPRFSEEGPAWSLGGKKFPREVEVERAGYALFEPWRVDQTDYREFVLWNGTRYEILLRGADQKSPVILEDQIIGLVNPVGVRQGVLFFQKNEQLIAKVLPLRNRRIPPKSISFGKRKLLIMGVNNLGEAGILIQTTDGTNNYWDVLDPRQWVPVVQYPGERD